MNNKLNLTFVHCNARALLSSARFQHLVCEGLIYGKVYEKRDLACIIKKYDKNALRLICYNFRTVNAINFLFSKLHTAPFLYGIIHFGVLHLLHVSIATFDTPLGSNPPLLSVGVINSLQIRFVAREVLYLSICSVR